MKQAWHIIDESKSQYYLVEVLPHAANSTRIPIQYQNEKYFVKATQLLPYSPQKSKNLYELQLNNSAQIIDWMRKFFENQGFWLKINKKLVIDFNNNTDKQRQAFINFIFGRFLVSQKRRQYLCISNDVTMCHRNGSTIDSLFSVFKSITNLWNYRIPLTDLSKVYGIFFRDIPIKLKVYVKKNEIIKLSIIPYNLFAKDLLGTTGTNEILNFNGRIFKAMANSSREVKRYYHIPYKSIPSTLEEESLETITNYLMHIGFNISEIKAIIKVYSIIMNINCIELSKGRKEERNQFKIRDGSIIKDNMIAIMGNDLMNLLQNELNTFQNSDDYIKKNVALKQELLMRIIYEEMTFKFSDLLNQKMCNLQATLDNYQQLILIEFPPLSELAQKTPEEYYINLMNEKIESMGLGLPFCKKTHQFKYQTVQKQIRYEYLCDINREILQEIEKTNTWREQLKNSKFMVYLRERMINIDKEQGKPREGKVEELYEELENLESNDEYSVNYVIQTSINEQNLPKRKELLISIQQSIQKRMSKRRITVSKNVQGKSHRGQQMKPQQQLEEQTDEDRIEIKSQIFGQRYIYCSFVKELNRTAPTVPFLEKLSQYFTNNKINGTINNEKGKVCVSVPFYIDLENQRRGHEQKVNKIKKQFKRVKFRHSLFANLELLYGKIKFARFLSKKVQPIQKFVLKELKRRNACSKLQETVAKILHNTSYKSMSKIKIRSGLQLMKRTLQNKESLTQIYKFSMKKLKDNLKRHRCPQIRTKISDVIARITQRLQRQCLKKLSYQYQIIVNPPLAPNYQSSKIKQQKPQLFPIREEPSRQSNHQSERNSLPMNENQVNHSSVKSQSITSQNAAKSHESVKLPPLRSALPLQTNKETAIKQQSQQKPREQSKKSQVQKPKPIHQPSHSNYNSNQQSNYSSFGQSTNRGIQKSQISHKLTQPQLFSLSDDPKFSFEIWYKESIGFQKRKPQQPQQTSVIKALFNKPEGEKEIHKQAIEELNVDILIKQKVVVNPFFPYLQEHIPADSEEHLQKIMSHQQKIIKTPLLSIYPIAKYPNTAIDTFNNILKIGYDKNTSKSKSELISMIVKVIRDTYSNEKVNISTVFQGEPAIINDYSWDHNIIKDQIFMQFIKQIMMNQREDSLDSLSSALEVITRYYYPSPKFIYAFLHYLKSLQSKNIEKLNQCFLNTLLFAQVFERYKGNNVTVLKEEILPKQKESYPQLEPRTTQISQRQIKGYLTIQVRLINEQIFEYRVRNETLSHFKRKLLKQINMLNYQQYFGIYYSTQLKNNHMIVSETKKAIDFLNECSQTTTDHLLYVKLKYYFPFNIKQINKTRICYLNSIIEERNLPWKGKDYENFVVLSMIFDEFDDYRIGNYLVFTNQLQANLDLSPIQDKYTEMVSQRGKKINEIEYLKEMKENGFLVAKAYRIRDDDPQSCLYKLTKIVIKPLELCFYSESMQRSSLGLQRIKGFGMQKGQIHIQIDYIDQQNHQSMRSFTLKNIDRGNEFYMDLTAYLGYLRDN